MYLIRSNFVSRYFQFVRTYCSERNTNHFISLISYLLIVRRLVRENKLPHLTGILVIATRPVRENKIPHFIDILVIAIAFYSFTMMTADFKV